MAIVVKHSFDGNFPPAALYLDDIERIVDILKSNAPEVFQPKQDSSGYMNRPEGAEFKFIVSDTECETIEELRQLGDSTHTLHIKAQWCSLRLGPTKAALDCRFWGNELEAYGSLLPIFQTRQRPAPMLWGVNSFFLWVQAVVITMLVCLEMLLFKQGHNIAGVITAILFIGTTISINKFHLPYSTIYFRRKRDPIPESARWLPKRQQIVAMIFTAILGGVVGWFIAKFK